MTGTFIDPCSQEAGALPLGLPVAPLIKADFFTRRRDPGNQNVIIPRGYARQTSVT